MKNSILSAMVLCALASYSSAEEVGIHRDSDHGFELAYPSSDGWTPTSNPGAPPARHRHTAVWTGSLMLVWGGKGTPTVNFGDGARYQC